MAFGAPLSGLSGPNNDLWVYHRRSTCFNRFGKDLVATTETAIGELSANFADEAAQGSVAYATIMMGFVSGPG
jgi:hypothetical protein